MPLSPLSEEAIAAVLRRALGDTEKGLGVHHLAASEEVLRTIARLADCDARVGLNLLEQASMLVPDGGELSHDVVEKVAGRKVYTYDKKGDAHYDTASAFIKSMRGSDPDAALHYLARMIEGGEQPSFIARRLVICAAEDVGLADPQALVVANAAAQAVQLVGWPEGRIILAEAVVYVACAPKSNSAYMAVDAALSDVRRGGCGDVPAYLRDSHYSGAASLGRGEGYQYRGVSVSPFVPRRLGRAAVFAGPAERQGVLQAVGLRQGKGHGRALARTAGRQVRYRR